MDLKLLASSILILLISVAGYAFWNNWLESSEPIVYQFDMSLRPVSVFVLGATGEVGKEVVSELAKNANIQNVTLIGRRIIELPKSASYAKFTQKTVDFDNLEAHSEEFKGHDVGICALGTTRGKSGVEGFKKVDHDYIVNSAKLAKEHGTKHFNLVSSGGANKNSMFLYMKVKGEVEEELKQMNFERLSIYQPGMLLCNRTEARTGESLLRSVFSCVDRWRAFSIETSVVGAAIVLNIFNKNQEAVEILSNTQIRDLAKSAPTT